MRFQQMEKSDSVGPASTDTPANKSTAGVTEPIAGVRKHRRIYELLREEILTGKYLFGDRVPSETTLVKQFKVSRPTAARALKDLEFHGLVERRHGAGTFVQHTGSTAQRTLGIFVTGMGQDEFFEPICNQLAKSVDDNNFEISWGQVRSDEAQYKGRAAEKTCQRLIQQGVAGVFFQPLEFVSDMNDVNNRIVKAFDKAKIPVVLVDTDFKPYPERSKCDLVGIDNRRVGYLLTEHLMDLGCKRIEFIAHRGASPTGEARIAGYREALFDHGITPQGDWAHFVDEVNIESVKQLVDTEPADAYICHNDFTAGQLMRDLIKRGIRIPEDVRVVGVDDSKYASVLSVPLTTVRQPCAEIGKTAMEL
ncbi:MAG: GntR family transcriptional regulator, partial [Bythopirellula sp.]